jgi:hypothetical protein
MTNTPLPIVRRVYYLRNLRGQCYVKTYYREGLFLSELKTTAHSISFSEASEVTTDTNTIKKLEKMLATPQEKWFWKNASADLRQSLILSFFIRTNIELAKIPNVETVNWTKDGNIGRHYRKLLRVAKVELLGSGRNSLDAMIRLQGRHARNLRFGHIHLSFDKLLKRPVYGIHWDAVAIGLDRQVIRHWLKDDMPS